MKKANQRKTDSVDNDDRDWDFKKIIKDVQLFSASHMTWKEKKELENQKVVKLGGKLPKKQRLPLSVARVQMKKQKEREEKIIQENMILGRFGGKLGSSGRRSADKFNPEERVLRSSEGYFRNGVLDVKHMLSSAPSRDMDSSDHVASKGTRKRKGSGKQKRGGGKKKGGGWKRR